ncbi:Hypothetical_protein [Hexamita inflata]|uniref:Hypothetical_protein n=1 Tax=Hexamita inflata TaxID=28002 RepID=A0AA86TPK7_9EUKA|nr:Hypothetical protein HINF_LOCUS9767 [Hexamita inflata]
MTHLTVTLSSVLRLNLIITSSSHKSWQSTNPNLVTQQRYLKLISISQLIFQDCHSEQPPQTTQVSSALELTLLTSEVILYFVTIFWMAGMNLGTSVSVATRSASKFRAGNNVITLQSVSSCLGSFTLESETSAMDQLHKSQVMNLAFWAFCNFEQYICALEDISKIIHIQQFSHLQQVHVSLLHEELTI